jgi:protein-tyrosine phosphatase
MVFLLLIIARCPPRWRRDAATAGASVAEDACVVNVLFVCLGNICRSPVAEGVFRSLVAGAGLAARIGCDSAGTSGWNIGRPPDPRAQQVAHRRGIDIAMLRARQVTTGDFYRFDFVLAMDEANLCDLSAIRPARAASRVALLLDFAPGGAGREVPDPYHGGGAEFARMLALIEEGTHGLLTHLRDRHAPAGDG